MKIIDNLNDFIEQVDNIKKINPMDLSSDQDLSIAIMNLISIEEHLFFSGAKTRDNSFYELINSIREMRKELLKKIIKTYKGEVWCISKHLLAGCMRLMEVGTKALSAEKKEEAYQLFEKAYTLYTLFWGLNINSLSEEETKDIIKKIDETTLNNIENINKNDDLTKTNEKETGTFKKLRNFVSKAIDCCRE